jgi:hypothetical protein
MKKLIFVFGVLCFFSMGAFAQNVGISDNAFTPQSLLHLQDAAGGNMLQISSSTAANTGFQVVLSGSDFSLINREAGFLSFHTSNTERMRILSGGNVGIGIAAPTERLVVNGNVYSSTGDFYAAALNGVINCGGGIMSATVNVISDGAVNLDLADGDEDLYINDDLEVDDDVRIEGGIDDGAGYGTNGYVLVTDGVGNITWTDARLIPGGNDDWNLLGNAGTNPTTNFLGTTDAQDLAFRTNNSEIVRFKTDGSVGIGTTTTNGMLDIRNNIDKSYGIFLDNNKTTTGTTYGIYLDFDNTYAGNATNFGIYSNLSNVAGNNSAQYGFYDYLYNHGTGNSYGTYINTRKAVNSGNNYGVYAEAAYGANAYGVYGAAYGATTNWAGYFAGNAHVSDRLAVANTDPQTSVDIEGDIAIRQDATTISITGGISNDNVSLASGYSFYRLTATGDATISGLSGGVDGRIVVLHNSSSYELVLENQDLSSTTTNRMELSTGDIVMSDDEVITLIYSETEGRWLEMAGTNNTQQLYDQTYTRTNTYSTTMQSFGSSTWTAVPGLSQYIYLDRKSKVMIWTSGVIRTTSTAASGGSGIFVRVKYNTTPMDETMQCTDAINNGTSALNGYRNVSSTWSTSHMEELDQGGYTFTVEVRKYVGDDADICNWWKGGGSDADYGKLTIMVVAGE